MPRPSVPPKSKRYRDLTLGLIAVLVGPSFLRPLLPHAGLLAAVLFVGLMARSLQDQAGSRVFRGVLAVAMLGVGLRAVSSAGFFWFDTHRLGFGVHALTTLGFSLVAIALLQRVLAAGPVDAEKLYAAVAAYLMVGLSFASAYETIDRWNPQAFKFASGAEEHDALFYFSLVTLSTVGYGDIVPVADQARVLAVCEAITGQLYLAILMARLVGLHLNQSNTALELDARPTSTEGESDGETQEKS